ncbi:hypothetical protein Micbo1qcDRAFT_177982 [Microdochium bolleyi]|uniref:Uncharacterized protein n=1 Tax=Microdochium bolleyi TaxID=196109 RepID=A0A136ITJ2_9PEZI|nr:hypothetical protein Micbo1qcDRAFT_177982 [Microdochium bolleyi]
MRNLFNSLRGRNTEAFTPAPIHDLGILARLPAELRQRLLVTAFGRRELHLDLRLVPRHWRPLHSRQGDSAHGRGSAPWSGNTPKTNPQDEREWRWYGCVCHRQPPWRGTRTFSWPHDDHCLEGEANLCAAHHPPPGKPRGTCDYIIGVLGWLLLYGTNVFILESQELLDLLLDPIKARRGHVVLPQHLAMVESLEVRIDTMLFQTPGKDYSYSYLPNWNRRQSLPHLSGLQAKFPSLRSLVISFTEYLYDDYETRPAARLPELKKALLDPLAEALAPFGATLEQPVVVELPLGVFTDLESLKVFAEEKRDNHIVDGRTWLCYPILCSDEKQFYHIKAGAELGLYWDYNDRPRIYGDAYFPLGHG